MSATRDETATHPTIRHFENRRGEDPGDEVDVICSRVRFDGGQQLILAVSMRRSIAVFAESTRDKAEIPTFPNVFFDEDNFIYPHPYLSSD